MERGLKLAFTLADTFTLLSQTKRICIVASPQIKTQYTKHNMPKVTPKVASKSSVKADPKAAKAAEKAAVAQEREKLIEGLVEGLSEKVTEYAENKAKVDNSFFEMADKLSEDVNENELSKSEARNLLLLSMADAYEIDVKEIAMGGKKPGPYVYTLVSKIMTLVFPKSEVCAKNLAKAKAVAEKQGGHLTTEDALSYARNPEHKGKVSHGKGKDQTGAKAAKKSDALTTDDDIKTALTVVIRKSIDGGFELDQIEEIFADLVAEYAADAEGKEEEGEE